MKTADFIVSKVEGLEESYHYDELLLNPPDLCIISNSTS